MSNSGSMTSAKMNPPPRLMTPVSSMSSARAIKPDARTAAQPHTDDGQQRRERPHEDPEKRSGEEIAPLALDEARAAADLRRRGPIGCDCCGGAAVEERSEEDAPTEDDAGRERENRGDSRDPHAPTLDRDRRDASR